MSARAVLPIVAFLALISCGAGSETAASRRPDARYEPSPPEVVEAMLQLAGVQPGDVLYDLGSGDGRIVIAAAKHHGARGVGIDIDPKLVAEARRNAEREGVSQQVTFREGDLFQADLREASVVTLYLLPEVNLRLRPKLWRELRPGTRVVSHAHDMGDWKPEKIEIIEGRKIYLWRIPSSHT